MMEDEQTQPAAFDSQDTNDELYERLVIVVDKGQEPLRLDKFLVNRMVSITRHKVQKGIEAGMVTVNNEKVKPNYKVHPEDVIIVFSDTAPPPTEIVPENIPLDFVFEDDHIIVINKPPGLVVHPGSGNYTGTLINGIAYHLRLQNPDLDESALPRFGMVHRIDKNTSGLLVLAKTYLAMNGLAKQFFDHTVDRKYVSLVWGDLQEDQGSINAHIGRNQRHRKLFEAYPEGDIGKAAITHYTVLERFGYVTLVECKLETGRTHQIRVHMKHLGHPVFNDDFYGGDKVVKGTVFSKYKMFVDNCFDICPRQALHAQTLGFTHPATGEKLFFEAPIPEDMEEVIEKWRLYVRNKR